MASPVLLVVVGLAASYLPGMPELELEPEWFLTIVLPPLLYAAAVNMPATDFRRDFKTIGALSVGLVLVSTFASGLLIHLLVPRSGWQPPSPSGPSSARPTPSQPPRSGAGSASREVGDDPGGEGLVNDATALVLLRSAIGATAGAVSLWGLVGDFAFAVTVGRPSVSASGSPACGCVAGSTTRC
ncbi:cation:proton antiporter domain-containing protein [Tessaracoccus coleopterorum]|uniref:cation:proton antiporter domain-containing protein n=1 Tax=Tessaracoccus coleopterorum TaxID=2714950 RepID=UPI0018D3B2D3